MTDRRSLRNTICASRAIFPRALAACLIEFVAALDAGEALWAVPALGHVALVRDPERGDPPRRVRGARSVARVREGAAGIAAVRQPHFKTPALAEFVRPPNVTVVALVPEVTRVPETREALPIHVRGGSVVAGDALSSWLRGRFRRGQRRRRRGFLRWYRGRLTAGMI